MGPRIYDLYGQNYLYTSNKRSQSIYKVKKKKRKKKSTTYYLWYLYNLQWGLILVEPVDSSTTQLMEVLTCAAGNWSESSYGSSGIHCLCSKHQRIYKGQIKN